MLVLEDPFKSAWSNKDAFYEVSNLDGEVYRAREGRRTLQFNFGDGENKKSYFLKYHQGIGWGEIFKNLVSFRLPVLGASNEYFAAKKLSALGVATLTPRAFGQRGMNPAKKESFIICDDLVETLSLEDYCGGWKKNPTSLKEKRCMIKKLAEISRIMHENGINHRDYYLCHFLVKENDFPIIDGTQLNLIDLHRCQIRKKTPARWIEKDLAGLYFSAMDIGLSRRDCLFFIKHYESRPLRACINNQLWKKTELKARRLYQKHT